MERPDHHSPGVLACPKFHSGPRAPRSCAGRRPVAATLAIGWLSAVAGYSGAVAMDASIAGAMGLVAAACFALALFCSPRYGLIARACNAVRGPASCNVSWRPPARRRPDLSEVQPSSALPLATARVVSSVPGRLRLRLASSAEGRGRLAAAADDLAAHGELLVAQPRPRSASLVISYDPGRAVDVWVRLRELGLQVPDAPGGAAVEALDPGSRVMTAVKALDAVVPRFTAGHDLRTLIPLGFGMLAARQLVRGEQRLQNAPWYVLAWYASESFQKAQRSRGDTDG